MKLNYEKDNSLTMCPYRSHTNPDPVPSSFSSCSIPLSLDSLEDFGLAISTTLMQTTDLVDPCNRPTNVYFIAANFFGFYYGKKMPHFDGKAPYAYV